MYWIDESSRIDALLKKPDKTLESLLDEDDVLQECIARNDALLQYLSEDTILTEMLNKMIKEPDSSDNEMENYKYSNTICEILTHEGNEFSKLIANNRKYLLILWSFVDPSCRQEIEQIQNDSNESQNDSEKGHSLDETLENTEEKDQNQNSKESVDSNDGAQSPTIDSEESDKSPNPNETVIIRKSADNPRNLNPLLASFFTKVFSHIFIKETQPVLEFLLSKHPPNDLVTVILKHIQISAIMDLIYKAWKHVNIDCFNDDIINNDNDSSQQLMISTKFNDLLIENRFIDQLVEMFSRPELESEQQNVAQLFAEMIRIKREILVNAKPVQIEMISKFDLESENTIRKLLNNMFECRTKNSIVNGLKIIQTLLQYNVESQNMVRQQARQLSSMIAASKQSSDTVDDDDDDDELESMPKFLQQPNPPNESVSDMVQRILVHSNDINDNDQQTNDHNNNNTYDLHFAKCLRNCSNVLNERLKDFVAILREAPETMKPMKTTVGIIDKPFGFIRLEVIHLFVALFATSDFEIMKNCSELNVLQILTDHFFTYSLNNQLHRHYKEIIGYIFQNYHNYKIIYDKHHQSSSSSASSSASNSSNASTPTIEINNQNNNEPEQQQKQNNDNDRISYFLNRFEISNTLVKQLINDCKLIEKILENFANETVPIKSYEMNDRLIDSEEKITKTKPKDYNNESNHNDNCDDADEVIMEEQSNSNNDNDTPTDNNNEIVKSKKAKLTARPGYMGHLRLIAITLKEHCTENFLRKCSVDESVITAWKEFVNGKLEQLNQLIASDLVPESKREESKFLTYEKEQFTVIQEIGEPKPLPDCKSINEQQQDNQMNEKLKLNNNLNDNEVIKNEIDKFWENRSEDFESIEKYFECSTRSLEVNKMAVQDVDDPWANSISFDNGGSPNDNTAAATNLEDQWSKRSEMMAQECFASFDSDQTNKKDTDLQNLEDYFTDIDVFNNDSSSAMNMDSVIDQQNPWGPTMKCTSSSTSASASQIVSDEGWANFLNDPFASSPNMNEPIESVFNDQSTTKATTSTIDDKSTENTTDDDQNKTDEVLFAANVSATSSPTRNNDSEITEN